MALQWLARGLRAGRVTTRYPAHAEEPGAGFRGRVDVLDAGRGTPELERLCPTGAIAVREDGGVVLDRGRCILCGNCVQRAPERFGFRPTYETAAVRREFFKTSKPTSTGVQVSGLLREHALIEISAVAVLRGHNP